MKLTSLSFRDALYVSVISLSLSLYGCSSSENENDLAGNNAGNVTDVDKNDDILDPPIGQTQSTAIGDVFASGDAQRTLYTFANDTDNVSNCTDSCISNWPAVTADSATTPEQFATIEREDGTLQWTFKNRPVYYYVGDASAGEINGEGLGGVWYVARPDPFTSGITSIGTVLVGRGSIHNGISDPTARTDVSGLTLYTFKNDTENTSTCNDQCSVNWPPLFADEGARASGAYSVITRSDNTKQWAQAGKPLYLYQGDAIAGDTNGNGVGGVWDVAVPN